MSQCKECKHMKQGVDGTTKLCFCLFCESWAWAIDEKTIIENDCKYFSKKRACEECCFVNNENSIECESCDLSQRQMRF